jgi:hypothetical protein
VATRGCTAGYWGNSWDYSASTLENWANTAARWDYTLLLHKTEKQDWPPTEMRDCIRASSGNSLLRLLLHNWERPENSRDSQAKSRDLQEKSQHSLETVLGSTRGWRPEKPGPEWP